jgi:hypothetical protein
VAAAVFSKAIYPAAWRKMQMAPSCQRLAFRYAPSCDHNFGTFGDEDFHYTQSDSASSLITVTLPSSFSWDVPVFVSFEPA